MLCGSSAVRPNQRRGPIASAKASAEKPADAEAAPPSTPVPANTAEQAADRNPAAEVADRESVLAALEPRRRELADARAAADGDSAQGTASYRAARGYEDSLLGSVAAADAAGANRAADQALFFYGRARAERGAILAQRSAAAERARAVAEPSHQRSGVARGDAQRKTAESALASNDFEAARAGFEAARDAYERAGRKSR